MVVDVIGISVLLVLLFQHILYEVRLWGRPWTPGTLLLGGYLVAFILHAFARTCYPIDPILLETYMIVGGYGFASLLISGFWGVVLRVQHGSRSVIGAESKYKTVPRYFLFVVTACYLYFILKATSREGSLFSDASEGAVTGMVAHLHVLESIAVMWYAISSRDKFMLWALCILIGLSSLALYPVKGWILVPFIGIVLAKTENSKVNLSWRAVMVAGLVALVGVGFFFGIYVLKVNAEVKGKVDFERLLPEIFEHLVMYCTAGISGFNAVVSGINLNRDVIVLFAPIINVVNYIEGVALISPVSEVWVDAGRIGSKYAGGNVVSFLGCILGYSGPWLALPVFFFFLSLGYIQLFISQRYKDDLLRVGAAFWLSLYAFGWFEFYFWHLRSFEVGLFCLFGYLLRLVLKHGLLNKGSLRSARS
jgi:hypothetical protein